MNITINGQVYVVRTAWDIVVLCERFPALAGRILRAA